MYQTALSNHIHVPRIYGLRGHALTLDVPEGYGRYSRPIAFDGRQVGSRFSIGPD